MQYQAGGGGEAAAEEAACAGGQEGEGTRGAGACGARGL